MNITKLHDMAYYYTDIFSDEELDIIQSTINNSTSWNKIFDDGHEYNPNNPDSNENQSIMNMERLVVVEDRKYNQIRDIINTAYKKAYDHYIAEFNISGDNPITPFGAVDKHMLGTAYATHIDSAPVGVESYTTLMYLNDDYTGGEISFTLPRDSYKFHVVNGILTNGPRSNRSPQDPVNKSLIDFWIKPAKGSILIFPPLYPYAHTVHTIHSGHKYIIKGHWQVNVADVTQWSASPYENLSKDSDLESRHNLMYRTVGTKNIVPEHMKEFDL